MQKFLGAASLVLVLTLAASLQAAEPTEAQMRTRMNAMQAASDAIMAANAASMNKTDAEYWAQGAADAWSVAADNGCPGDTLAWASGLMQTAGNMIMAGDNLDKQGDQNAENGTEHAVDGEALWDDEKFTEAATEFGKCAADFRNAEIDFNNASNSYSAAAGKYIQVITELSAWLAPMP